MYQSVWLAERCCAVPLTRIRLLTYGIRPFHLIGYAQVTKPLISPAHQRLMRAVDVAITNVD
jgi:hypothetical protein